MSRYRIRIVARIVEYFLDDLHLEVAYQRYRDIAFLLFHVLDIPEGGYGLKGGVVLRKLRETLEGKRFTP